MALPVRCFKCGARGRVEKLGKPINCRRCGSGRVDLDDPILYRTAADDDQGDLLKCSQCGATFEEKSDLDDHKQTHEGDSLPDKKESKLAQLTAAILRTNPNLGARTATRVARQTLARYPKVAGRVTADEVGSKRRRVVEGAGDLSTMVDSWNRSKNNVDEDHFPAVMVPPDVVRRSPALDDYKDDEDDQQKAARLRRQADDLLDSVYGPDRPTTMEDQTTSQQMQSNPLSNPGLAYQGPAPKAGPGLSNPSDSGGNTPDSKSSSRRIADVGEPARESCPQCGRAGYSPQSGHCTNCGYNGPSDNKDMNLGLTPWDPRMKPRMNDPAPPVSEKAPLSVGKV